MLENVQDFESQGHTTYIPISFKLIRRCKKMVYFLVLSYKLSQLYLTKHLFYIYKNINIILKDVVEKLHTIMLCFQEETGTHFGSK